MVLHFGDYTLDRQRFELRCGQRPVHVEPQVFDVLSYLIEHRDRVVPKEELLDEVWGDRFVSESTLTTRVKAARRAIGDDGESQRWIRTVRHRGYQFVGEVHAVPDGAAAAAPLTTLPTDSAVRDATATAPVTDEVSFCRGADGVRIAYATSGSGPPLVKAANWMTHLGRDSGSLVWRHWIASLSEGHRLVRYDERGCGLSEWDVPSFGFDDWVLDLEEVVDAAGVDTFPLLGISQGAAVAIAYAVRHPERVERLILVSGYLAGRGARATTAQDRAAAALDIELARVGWGRSDPAFRRVFAMQFFPDGPPQVWDAFDDLQRQTTTADNAVRFLQEFGTVDVRELAGHVDCPTLVLHSREDHRVPFSCAQLAHELIPASRLVPLPSRNHLLSEGEPAWPVLLDEVRAFLG